MAPQVKESRVGNNEGPEAFKLGFGNVGEIFVGKAEVETRLGVVVVAIDSADDKSSDGFLRPFAPRGGVVEPNGPIGSFL